MTYILKNIFGLTINIKYNLEIKKKNKNKTSVSSYQHPWRRKIRKKQELGKRTSPIVEKVIWNGCCTEC